MKDPDGARPETARNAEPLGRFGFDAANEPWMEEIRRAEAPLPFGFIGPYQLEEEVSRGGQGIVFKARQPGTRRQVAVKRLLGGSFATPGMRRRFEREVEALTALNHPNIVTIFAMDVVEGVPVLAMEWIDGVPIDRWSAECGVRSAESDAKNSSLITHHSSPTRRGVREVLELFIKVCDAVQHAHQRGVIHRDLKPSNILIDASGSPHIVDFGLAKFGHGPADPAAAAPHRFVGTLAYASPEQLGGEDDDVDVRSDVYSLGVILCELLTGTRPCDLNGQTSPADAESGPDLGRIATNLHPDLRAIVRKALSRDKQSRYQSADALTADLRSFMAGAPVSARPVHGWEQLRKTLRRHRVAVALTLGALTVVSLFAGITSVLAVRLAEQRDLAVRAQEREAAARAHAEQESAKARAINSFMQDMLASADPRRSGDPQLTVRDVLASAAGRLRSQLGDQTDVKAEIEVVLGRTYQNLGLLDAAESHLRSALDHYRSTPYGERESMLNVLTELATVLHSKGDHRSAGAITEEAVVLYRELLGQGHPLLQADVVGMAGYYFVRGDFEAARNLYEEALAAHRRLLGDNHPAVAADLAGLACLLGQIGEPQEAVDLAYEGLNVLRAQPNLETPELAVSLFDIARALHQARAFDEALAIYEEAIGVQERVYGDDHAILAETLFHYGDLLATMDSLVEAEVAFRRALVMQGKLFGEDHRSVASGRAKLGLILLDQNCAPEAEVELRSALASLEAALPAGHWSIAQRQHELGRCLTALGRYPEAEAYLLNSHALLSDRRRRSEERTDPVRQSLVELYAAWNQPDQAAKWRVSPVDESIVTSE